MFSRWDYYQKHQISCNEVYYLNPDMYEAHDALTCIGSKTYVNEKNRVKYSDQHYLKSNDEMSNLFSDLPEALENNFNLEMNFDPFRYIFSDGILSAEEFTSANIF